MADAGEAVVKTLVEDMGFEEVRKRYEALPIEGAEQSVKLGTRQF